MPGAHSVDSGPYLSGNHSMDDLRAAKGEPEPRVSGELGAEMRPGRPAVILGTGLPGRDVPTLVWASPTEPV